MPGLSISRNRGSRVVAASAAAAALVGAPLAGGPARGQPDSGPGGNDAVNGGADTDTAVTDPGDTVTNVP